MKRPVLFIIANITIIVVLSVIQVVVANSISTTGIELGELNHKISSIKKENEILREQVLTGSSLTTIASKAGELGFESKKAQLVISDQLPLARR